MTEIPQNAINAKKAAQWLGVSERRVYQLLNGGRIAGAVRFSGVWLIPPEPVVEPKKRGRPKGAKTKKRS